jgi:addiction module HigA family antidote
MMSKSPNSTEPGEPTMRADMVIHPGEILREEFLVPHGLSANRLAAAMGVPTNRITAILNGDRGVTGETALLLGRVFATTPEFWMNLQVRYELDLATSQVARERLAAAEAFGRTLAAGSLEDHAAS